MNPCMLNNVNYNLYASNLNKTSFRGKSEVVQLLKTIVNPSVQATKGHVENVFFKTNLNARLRHPESAIIDELQYMANQSMANPLKTGIGAYYVKIPLTESPTAMKERLNAEFRLLPGLKKNEKFFRGIEDISDSDYNKFLSYKKGQTVCPDEGYAYMTKNMQEANLYNRKQNGVLFEIEVPEKSQISQLNCAMPSKSMGLEIKRESVVPAGSMYEVTNDSVVDNDGILHVYLKFLNYWK